MACRQVHGALLQLTADGPPQKRQADPFEVLTDPALDQNHVSRSEVCRQGLENFLDASPCMNHRLPWHPAVPRPGRVRGEIVPGDKDRPGGNLGHAFAEATIDGARASHRLGHLAENDDSPSCGDVCEDLQA